MEGSYGTHKEHYGLRRVKARTRQTEVIYIFFGIHTANMVRLADRMSKEHSWQLLDVKKKQSRRSCGELYHCHGKQTRNPA